jgi:hypothetical protein
MSVDVHSAQQVLLNFSALDIIVSGRAQWYSTGLQAG